MALRTKRGLRTCFEIIADQVGVFDNSYLVGGFEAPATKRPTAALGSNEIRTIKPSIFTDGVESRERAL